ncbi:ankyrin repeat-containing domain protein [Pestalotiopsis sp. NC0098]|nr:ankyrin repeat-containing domain protein [Pestalotiopsis sp. NC0098]
MAFTRCVWTPLHVAIWHGHLGSVRLLMARGASFRTGSRPAGRLGRVPSTMAGSALHSAAAAGRLSVILEVLKHFSLSDVDILDDQGLTPLRWAYTRGSMTTVKFLCGRGAEINHPGLHEHPLIVQACALGRFSHVSVLLDLGADAAMTSKHGLTALLHLCNNILDIFNAYPDSIETESHKLSKARFAMQALLRHGADANEEDPMRGEAPLTIIAEYCQTDMIQVLLDHNADVNAIGLGGMTALRAACNATDSIPASDMKKTVKLLLEHGASVYTRGGGSSWTVLDDLAENCLRDNRGRDNESLGGVLEVILDHGIQFVPSMDTSSLIERFFIFNHIDCCRLLIEHGIKVPKSRIQKMANYATIRNYPEGVDLARSLERASESAEQSTQQRNPPVHAEPDEGMIDDVDVTAREKSPSP